MSIGFKGMDPERQRQIARLGGQAAHRMGRAHEWTTETAREAGRKGGRIAGERKKARKAAAAEANAVMRTLLSLEPLDPLDEQRAAAMEGGE